MFVYLMSVYPALAILGVPLFFVARSRGWLSGWHFFVLGACVSLTVVAPLALPALATYVVSAPGFVRVRSGRFNQMI